MHRFRMFPDVDCPLWIGTWGDGLDHFDPGTESITHYQKGSGSKGPQIPDNRVQSLLATDDAIWIGTRGSGLARLDRKSGAIQVWNRNGAAGRSLRDDRVWSIAAGGDGTIWIGTDTGLQALDASSGSVAFVDGAAANPHALAGQTIRCLTVTREGSLWIGTPAGAYRLARDRSTLEMLVLPDTSSDPVSRGVNAILEDHRGTIWIGTMQDGLYSWEPSVPRQPPFHHHPL